MKVDGDLALLKRSRRLILFLPSDQCSIVLQYGSYYFVSEVLLILVHCNKKIIKIKTMFIFLEFHYIVDFYTWIDVFI